jgi:hypothetical protein
VTFAVGLVAYGAVFMFLTAYLPGAAGSFDPSGRLAVGANGGGLIMYAVGPFAFGVLSDVLPPSGPGMLTGSVCAFALVPLVVVARALETRARVAAVDPAACGSGIRARDRAPRPVNA